LSDAETRKVIAGNELVLVVPADAADPPARFEDLADPRFKRVAVGHPATVPAGDYAMQALTALKLSDAVAERLVYGNNVRHVLVYVERGEVDAGVVYKTDALASAGRVKVAAAADPSWHEPIRYPAVVLKASRKQQAARRFLGFLAGDKAQGILRSKGFTSEAGDKETRGHGDKVKKKEKEKEKEPPRL
jgi:molybdate transport system substrate-binding protein